VYPIVPSFLRYKEQKVFSGLRCISSGVPPCRALPQPAPLRPGPVFAKTGPLEVFFGSVFSVRRTTGRPPAQVKDHAPSQSLPDPLWSPTPPRTTPVLYLNPQAHGRQSPHTTFFLLPSNSLVRPPPSFPLPPFRCNQFMWPPTWSRTDRSRNARSHCRFGPSTQSHIVSLRSLCPCTLRCVLFL